LPLKDTLYKDNNKTGIFFDKKVSVTFFGKNLSNEPSRVPIKPAIALGREVPPDPVPKAHEGQFRAVD
jgi:hypothetical protein